MNPTEDEETDDLSVIYHRGGLDAVYEAGRSDGIADTFHGIAALTVEADKPDEVVENLLKDGPATCKECA